MRKTTGISLILLIFLSLCLITFSLLSLSGATADERLSQKAADRTTEYYAAVSEANKMLADIDRKLAEYLTMSNTPYCSDENPFENNTISFDIAVTESQQLHVVLELHYPETSSESMYDITEWKIINTQEWHADRSQNLFRTDAALSVQ